ncbi:MAG: undecaprenyl-diphosphate phosphatase [Geitlerinemataceae cyanobacterium]
MPPHHPSPNHDRHLPKLTAIALGIAALLWAIALDSPARASEGLAPDIWNPSIFQAVVLGMVQGLTEFVPISSTAHLKMVPELLGWGDPGAAFSAAIQLGSIAAVLGYFWNDLRQVVGGATRAIGQRNWQSRDFRIALGIAIGTVPIVAIGLTTRLFFNDFYELTVRTSTTIASVSILMGLLLGFAEELCRHARDFENLGVTDGILIGLAQAMAIVPGVSRSGSTMTAGLFLGLDRATAARFSFLLGIPAISLAGMFELKDLVGGIEAAALWALVAGLISALVFSYLAIAWLIRFLQTQSTWVFVWYRFAFGVFVFFAIASGWIGG